MVRTFILLASFAVLGCVPDVPATDAGLSDAGMSDSGGDAPPMCGVNGLPCCSGLCSGGAVCTAGTCTCGMGTTVCGASCVDIATDGKNCGACGHDCLSGQCAGGKCKPFTLLQGGMTMAVTSIVVGPASIFWSTSTAIYKANIDGSSPVQLYGNGASCDAVSVDATNVYFTCAMVVYKCAVGGCNMMPTALTTALAAPIRSTAIDTANNRLYFSVGTATGFVASVPTGGGSYARLVPADQPNPISIVIANGSVYWLNSGTYTNNMPDLNGGVKKAPPGVNQSETTVTSDNTSVELWSLSVDSTNAYWANSTLIQVRTAPLSGGAPSKVIELGGTYVDATQVDGSWVYWAASGGAVGRCSKTSCVTPEILADKELPGALAQDTKAIYWSTQAGEIRRLAK